MESDTTAIELLDRLAKTWAKWIGPSGDREQYKRMSQFAADGAAALRERDTLRAELAAANERAEKAEAERAVALRCSGENAKAWQEAVCDEAVKRTHLLKEIGLAEQQRNALAARVAELEGAIRTMLESAVPHPVEHPTMTEAWAKSRAALARTPAQTLAKVQAAAVGEAVKECQNATDWCESELQGRQAIIDRVSDMAERLEADAARAAEGGKG